MKIYYDREGNSLDELPPDAFDIKRRRVALTKVGDVTVSTVHLVFDHRIGPEGPPLIFETMTAVDGDWGDQWRYATEAEALIGHQQVVAGLDGQAVELDEWED